MEEIKENIMQCYFCGSGLHEIKFPSVYLLCKNNKCNKKYTDTPKNRELCKSWNTK